jgi:ubiquinone/menaquinone biosynthesis C-methylase UbiE
MTLQFPKRIAEPKLMGAIEMESFNQLSKSNYKRWMLPLVDGFLEIYKIRRGQILDVACGPGLLSKELAIRLPQATVTGIDYSKHAINLAKQNCQGLANSQFRQMDAYRIQFSSAKFDAVVCKDSLHHFNKPTQALKEMLRVLKPGGLLYLQDMRRDLPGYLLKLAMPPDTVTKQLQYYSTRAAYTKSEIANVLKKMGIKNFNIKTKIFNRTAKLKYQKLGIEPRALIAGAQSRFTLTITKPS